MAHRTLTISFLASSGIHAALLAGLMVTGFHVGSPNPSSAAATQTTIAFAPFASQAPQIFTPDIAAPQPPVTDLPPQIPPPASSVPDLAPPQDAAPEVVLGIDDGRSDSKNWIGFKDPTEFRAPKSTVDQAEVSLNPGNPSIASGAPGKAGPAGAPGLPGQPAPPASPPAPAPDSSPTLSPTSPSPTASSPTASSPAATPPSTPTSTSTPTPALKGDAPVAAAAQEEIKPLHAAPGTPTPPPPAASPFDQAVPAQEKGTPDAAPADTGTDSTSRQPQESRPEKTAGDPKATSDTGTKVDAPASASASPDVTLPPQAPTSEPKPSPATVPPTPVPAAPTSIEPLTLAATQPPAPSAPAQRPPSDGNQGQQGSNGNNASGAIITGDKPGERDDREADASATLDSIDVIPGRPAAAKGLRIQTSRPQWSMTTKLTARPGNPSIRITFGPTGRVSSAEFVRGKSTGYPDVDQPLLNAIYRWTARGEAIDKLNPTDPRSGVSITVNILLN